MWTKIKLSLGAVCVLGLLASACGGGASGGGDQTPEAVKESERQKAMKALGLTEGALKGFEEATAILSGDSPDLVKAEALLQGALKESPNFLEARYNLGVVQEKRGRYKEAIGTYQEAMTQDKLNTHTVKFLLAIGRAQALDGQGAEAVKTFEEVHRLDPENLDVLNSLASAYLTAGKREEALDHVKRVLKEDNENLTALNTLAQVYTEQDNRSMAVYVFKKAARVALGAFGSDELLAAEPAVLVLGDKYDSQKVNGPLTADLLNNLGLIYLKMEELPLAVANFQAAGKLDGEDVESRLNIGALYLKYLNYEGALSQFELALKAEPSNCTAILGLSASQFSLGQEPAADGYKRFLGECDEKDTSAMLQLERIYERKQDFENAIKYCQLFVQSGGQSETVNADYCKALENMATMQRDAPKNPEGGEGGEGGEPPVEGGEPPAEGGEAPAEGAAPVEGGEAPVEGGEAPVEGGEAAPQ
jgi:tetratricopeptide (TPR) repeat protein